MSLEISPSTPSTSNRPLPPSRSKRQSLVASTPSSRHASPGVSATGVATPPAARGAGVMGGLSERTEEELKRASREAIEEALREEWEVRDRLLQKMEQMETDYRAAVVLKKDLEGNLRALQIRTEESMADQTRLETDLVERDEVLERLRGRLSQAEIQARDLQKRASEQEAAFEAERQALQAQESHLQQRLHSLLAAKGSPSKSSSPRPDEALPELQEELATLNVSHTTLLAQLNTVTKEVSELRQANAALQEENEGWEFLVRERTFASQTRDMSADHAAPNQDASTQRRSRGHLEALDEEMEMDELHSDLDAQSPILDDEQGYIRDLDHTADYVSSRSTNGRLALPTTRRKPKGESLGDLPLTSSGLDLAAELGRAEVDLDGSEMRVLGKGDEGEALRAEIKSLREANKALTLYCSKIIDRIITQEGFEQVLSVDYKTRRLGSRSAPSQARGSLKDITANMQEQNIAVDQPAAVERKNSVNKKARPLSFFGRAPSAEPVPEPEKPVVEEDKVEAKADKGAKKRFSLDLRSLGFGLPALSSPAEPKPNPALRPLTLAPKTTAASLTGSAPTARKSFATEEEDENDKRERHRMEAHLRLMGIEKPLPVEEAYAPSATYWTGRKISKANGTRTSSHSSSQSRQSSGMVPSNSQDTNFRDGTPLSRLSSHLGSPDDPVSPIEHGERSPRSIAAALKAFDEKEAERAKALAQGKAVTGFTSPSPGSIRRASGRKRTSEERKMAQSGSVDTLWSIGSSRPNSGEVVLNDEKK